MSTSMADVVYLDHFRAGPGHKAHREARAPAIASRKHEREQRRKQWRAAGARYRFYWKLLDLGSAALSAFERGLQEARAYAVIENERSENLNKMRAAQGYFLLTPAPTWTELKVKLQLSNTAVYCAALGVDRAQVDQSIDADRAWLTKNARPGRAKRGA
jgi:hypothetical protein